MKANSKLINDYMRFKKTVKNLEGSTVTNQKIDLINYEKFINKPFNKVTESKLLEYLEQFKPSTRNIRISELRSFYKWILKLDDEDKLPVYLRRIKFSKVKQDDIQYRERYITQQEYELIIDNASTPKHRAIIETLFNFGVRKSELTSMKTKDVNYDGEFTKITVRESKTKTRDIVKSGRSKYLLGWKETYNPNKDQPDSPLFAGKNGKATHPNGINVLITRTCKRAGIERKISPHDFRHSSITNSRAKGIPDTHIETNYGLVHGTQQLRTYDHNKTRSLEKYLRERNNNTPITYETLKEQKETLEQKHQKELDELKERMIKFEQFFDGSTIEKTKDGIFLVDNDTGIINTAHPNEETPNEAYYAAGNKKTGFKIRKTEMKLVSTDKNGIETWKPLRTKKNTN